MQEHLDTDPTGESLRADPLLQEYLNRPVLFPHLREVWSVFWRLSRRRPVGFAVGAIPMVEFESYCRTFGIASLEHREWLFTRLDALDDEYLKITREKSEQKTAKK
jgi:hypothetical protein